MITEAEIQDLKARHGDFLTQVNIEVEGNKKTYIIKPPTRTVIDIISDEKTNTAEVSKVLINNCVVFGDLELIEKNGKVYTTLLAHIKDEVGNYKSEAKKL
ncbi:hypothetical protein ETU09_00490 [Apibacter muscae]|uniref:Uncharacterized protein n=1 Tax=Apibacter muscae TaxID=2509004 RepID=A0A563DKG6_9FLAO|nr:hypothetical protein [Apibacter muscae]TWP30511.1 hypothetical protein ETU09_00490 [Apibacter muscae]